MLREEEDASGSTGVVAIYDGRKRVLTVAGVGDSLCVLCRNGRAVEMNKMHRMDNAAEKERVKKAGGTIINNRVNGVLAVSRAFGDTQFKTLPAMEGKTLPLHRLAESLVTALPEIHSEIITPKTEFAVLATDGLWDVMAQQVVISYIRNKLITCKDLQKVAKDLTLEAIARGSVDNVSAVILTFNSSFSP